MGSSAIGNSAGPAVYGGHQDHYTEHYTDPTHHDVRAGVLPQPRPHAGALGGSGAVLWELPPERTSAATARALTRETLAGWRTCTQEDVDDVVLMVDELVTNAVVHGTGPVTLSLRLNGPVLTAEVADGCPARPRPSGVHPGGLDWSEAGRGLMLVRALAGAFGTDPLPQGKIVWFTRTTHRPS